MKPESLPDIIAALRAVKGWSQEELADRAGVSRNYISLIESGTQSMDNLTLGTLNKILAAFDMRADIHLV